MKMKKQLFLGTTLAFLMAASVTATAFAAPTDQFSINDEKTVNALESGGDVRLVDGDATASKAQFFTINDEKTVNALESGGDVKLVDGHAKYNPEVAPMASGNLALGKGYTFDSQKMSEGQNVTINIDYTPTSSDMEVGLKAPDGNIYYDTVGDGSGSVTLEVNVSGTYSIYVGNLSSVSVHFNTSYFVD